MIQIEQIGDIRMFRMARSVLGRGLYFTTCYWVDGMLVDTGCAHAADELVSALGGLNVELIVNTHSHEDHIGGNAAVQERYGAKAFAHLLALPFIDEPRRRRLRPYQFVMWGYAAPSMARAAGKTVHTKNHCFRVIETPGHSPDHVCLYEPDMGWVFTGDAYIGGRDRSLRRDYDIWGIIASLRKIAQLEVKILFPASGSVRRDPNSEIRLKIGYLEELGGRVLELYDRGYSQRAIRRKLLGPEMMIAYFTLGHFSGENLVRSFIVKRPSSCSQ
jgi:glyoxylase-like metal-dependent hydrolase (beta-lactamase superfamily II)